MNDMYLVFAISTSNEAS